MTGRHFQQIKRSPGRGRERGGRESLLIDCTALKKTQDRHRRQSHEWHRCRLFLLPFIVVTASERKRFACVPARRLLGGRSLRGPDGPGCWGWTGWHSVTGKGCSPLDTHACAHTHSALSAQSQSSNLHVMFGQHIEGSGGGNELTGRTGSEFTMRPEREFLLTERRRLPTCMPKRRKQV